MTSPRPGQATLSLTDKKTVPSHLEEYADDISKDPHRADDGHILLPASLQVLSDEEYKSLSRKATWKVIAFFHWNSITLLKIRAAGSSDHANHDHHVYVRLSKYTVKLTR